MRNCFGQSCLGRYRLSRWRDDRFCPSRECASFTDSRFLSRLRERDILTSIRRRAELGGAGRRAARLTRRESSMTAISAQVRGDTPPPATETDDNRLVDAEELRTRLFGANPPSSRWIREQTKRGIIPSL